MAAIRSTRCALTVRITLPWRAEYRRCSLVIDPIVKYRAYHCKLKRSVFSNTIPLCCFLHYVCIPTFTTFALPGIVNGSRVYRAVADASTFFSIVFIIRSQSSSAASLLQPLCFHKLIELTARSLIVPCLLRSITTHRPLSADSISLRFLESASISRLNWPRKRTYERRRTIQRNVTCSRSNVRFQDRIRALSRYELRSTITSSTNLLPQGRSMVVRPVVEGIKVDR